MKAQLKTAMMEAIKARDKVRADAIRLLVSAVQYEEMAKETDTLNDEDIIAVVKRELKKRREECETAEQAGRTEIVQRIQQEVAVMEEFLPTQLNREQLQTIVKNLIYKNDSANIGSIMKELQANYSGQYDGKLASELVRELLQGS